jgi:hypothetical protein
VGLSRYRKITVPNPLIGPTTEGNSFLIERQFAPDQVRLVAQRTPSPEVARRVLLQLWNDDQTNALLGREDTQFTVQSLYVTDCDPNTLVPKRFLKQHVWQSSIMGSDGQPRRIGRTEKWTYHFAVK